MESSDRTFAEDIQRAGRPVVVVFWAQWARNCRDMEAWLDRLVRRLGDVPVITINTDTNPMTTNAHGVHCVPTLAIVTPTGVAWRVEGPPDVESLVAAWNKALTKMTANGLTARLPESPSRSSATIL